MATSVNLPNFPEFELHPRETGPTRFEKCIKRLKNMFEAMNITKDSHQKATLLHYVGEKPVTFSKRPMYPSQPKEVMSSRFVSKPLQNILSHRNALIITFMYFDNKRRSQMRTLLNFIPFTIAFLCEFSDSDLEIKRQII